MKILLAVDPPEATHGAVAELGRRPWPDETSVEVLSVIEPSQVWDVPSLLEGLKEAARDTSQAAADQLRAAGLDAGASVRCGHPKAVIVERAREIGADFVFVGSRGTTGITRFLLGSVAAAVTRFAPCSVEIVRPRQSETAPQRPMRILLATDGSDCSELAARSVARRPWPDRATFRVLSVAELSAPLLGMPYFSHVAMEELRAQAMRRAEEAEMAAEEVLTNARLDVTGTVAVPSAATKEIILRNADEWDADLIVCGSHGRRGMSHFLLGSVSEAVASHARCSVEIIRRAHV